jgi:NAD(P)-dependent dehydrogenase (short-subunit alcohol dehydrogenase family)
VTETITIDVPRQGIGDELTKALAEHGLEAVVLDDDERCALEVRFAANERERLLDDAVHAIESYLSDRMLPLVVQRANGGAVVRPPGD